MKGAGRNVGGFYAGAGRPSFFDNPRRACKGVDSKIFFPEGPGASANEARNVCATCPFWRPCGEHAIATSAHGVWGGTTFDDREAIRKARRARRRKAA